MTIQVQINLPLLLKINCILLMVFTTQLLSVIMENVCHDNEDYVITMEKWLRFIGRSASDLMHL